MLNEIQFGWGRQSVGKGYSFAVLIVAVFAIVNCKALDSTDTDAVVKDVVKRANRPIVRGLDTSPPRPWNPSKYSHNPCYWDYGKRVCGPAVYLMGIQYAGLDKLKQAIDLHPDVDCYSTRFFSGFSDMEGDSGRDLARPYDLEENAGVLSAPEFTTASALNELYSGMKVIVILRDPTVRFIREYCALLYCATPFAEYVDDIITDFIDCENNATHETASCVYDASLSGLLQVCHLVTFSGLRLDIPSSYDPFCDALDALFVPKTGNCNGQTITDAAKQKLEDFYSTRATIHLSLDPVP